MRTKIQKHKSTSLIRNTCSTPAQHCNPMSLASWDLAGLPSRSREDCGKRSTKGYDHRSSTSTKHGGRFDAVGRQRAISGIGLAINSVRRLSLCLKNDPDRVKTLVLMGGAPTKKTIRLLNKNGYICCMQHIKGDDRNQTLLLPIAVDDYVCRENPVRFIEAFVDQCDLQEAGFRRVQPKDTGRPGYDPADLLKLYIYGYVNRVRSSRRLEAETARNLEVIWLLRGLRPDFKTIADFRKDNRHAFKPVFRQFVLLCRKRDLFGRELLAVDGTRLKAVNSTDRNFTREKLVKMIRSADERLADYLTRLDRTDAEEDGASGRRAKNLTEKIAAWVGEGTGRIQPDGAGLQFHPCGEHRGRRDPPQSSVKEGGRLPAGHPRGYTLHPRGAGGLSCGHRNGDRSRGSDTVKCHSRSVSTRSGPFMRCEGGSAGSRRSPHTLVALAICRVAPGNGDRSSRSDAVKCHAPERFHTFWTVFETSRAM